jgi:hypothetical protein
MNRWIATCIAAAVTSAAAVGCSSNAYQPDADTAKLASVAAQTKYPSDMTPVTSDNIIYSIGDNGVITLLNAGSESVSNFKMWVNKSYFLEVNDQLAAHTSKTFAPENFYNKDGTTLKAEPVSQDWLVQMVVDGKLTNPKGPVKM